MKTLLTLLLLTLPVASIAAAPPGEQDNPAARIKSAIDRDWVARSDSGGVEISSPSYPMPYKQGCVIHNLYFPTVDRNPALGHMVTQDRYFVFAADEACASADPAQFFSIEPANDTFALLDFGRRLKGGPRPGKDRIAEGDRARVSECFAPGAMAATRIVRARSWRQEGNGRDDRYQVTLHCKAVDDAGEIVALGIRGQDAIALELRPWGQVTVDLPAPPETPDYSHVTTREAARKLVNEGKLFKILLFPAEFGGQDDPLNTVYVPAGIPEIKAHITGTLFKHYNEELIDSLTC